MLLSKDPSHMPGSQESPADRFRLAAALAGTAGQTYVEKRGVPLQVAEAAGVRFDADFGGRPAVLAPLLDCKKLSPGCTAATCTPSGGRGKCSLSVPAQG